MNLALLSDANTIYIYQTFGIREPDKMHAATDVPLVKLKKRYSMEMRKVLSNDERGQKQCAPVSS